MLKIHRNLELTFLDYPEDDWAIIVYFLGCSLNCNGCQNEILKDWDSHSSEYLYLSFYGLDNLLERETKKNFTKNVVFSGGDPLYKKNLNELKIFLGSYGWKYNICIYTGQDINTVKNYNLTNFKYLKCGHYNKNLLQNSVKLNNGKIILASSNQEFYNHNYEVLF